MSAGCIHTVMGPLCPPPDADRDVCADCLSKCPDGSFDPMCVRCRTMCLGGGPAFGTMGTASIKTFVADHPALPWVALGLGGALAVGAVALVLLTKRRF